MIFVLHWATNQKVVDWQVWFKAWLCYFFNNRWRALLQSTFALVTVITIDQHLWWLLSQLKCTIMIARCDSPFSKLSQLAECCSPSWAQFCNLICNFYRTCFLWALHHSCSLRLAGMIAIVFSVIRRRLFALMACVFFCSLQLHLQVAVLHRDQFCLIAGFFTVAFCELAGQSTQSSRNCLWKNSNTSIQAKEWVHFWP